jgi:hypothetical protein
MCHVLDSKLGLIFMIGCVLYLAINLFAYTYSKHTREMLTIDLLEKLLLRGQFPSR